MTIVPGADRYMNEPIAGDSAQFPLARPIGARPARGEPSPIGLRPWNLRAMRIEAPMGDPLPAWRFDHEHQVAVDADGRVLAAFMDATAKSVSDNDGDEGRSEDWTYDFTPDSPGQPF